MRVEAGAVVDEFDLPGIGHVVARHTRTKTPDGGVTWACMFTIAAAGSKDLAVVHRLSAPSLYEGRRSVRHAVEFLAGRAFSAGVAAVDNSEHDPHSEHDPRPDDDLAWRPPAGHLVSTGLKRALERRVALSPTRGHGRRATDRRRDPDRGVVPDLALFSDRSPDRGPGGEQDGITRPDAQPPVTRDPEPSPLR